MASCATLPQGGVPGGGGAVAAGPSTSLTTLADACALALPLPDALAEAPAAERPSAAGVLALPGALELPGAPVPAEHPQITSTWEGVTNAVRPGSRLSATLQGGGGSRR